MLELVVLWSCWFCGSLVVFGDLAVLMVLVPWEVSVVLMVLLVGAGGVGGINGLSVVGCAWDVGEWCWWN